MSPPLLGAGGEGQSEASLALSPSSFDSVLKERNYFGLSDSSSVDSSNVTSLSSDDSKRNLNLKATELRLGLPGSQSPDRDSKPSCLLGSGRLDEKPLFPLTPLKTANGISGNKRGFSDTAGVKSFGVKEQSGGAQQQAVKDTTPKSLQEPPRVSNNSNNAPAAKTQVVGWPPIGSFRKNNLATSSKNNDEVDGKPGAGPLFVKVSMDGAPYLRKVDLRLYSTYQEISCALEEMFSCFTLGRCGSEAPGREIMSESKLKDLLHGSEYVLTYEDKDGDWMLVGDVPWEMFTDLCKRLKIMKSTDAIGLAPRATEKSKIGN